MYVAMPKRPHLSRPCPAPFSPQLKAALQSGHFHLSPSEVEQLAEQVGWLFSSFCWAHTRPALLATLRCHGASFCCTLRVSTHTLTSTCLLQLRLQHSSMPPPPVHISVPTNLLSMHPARTCAVA